jgi:hypothetical protein
LRIYGVLNLNEWYRKEVTEASFKELISLTKWINKIYGYFPVVIGGWAVYSYVASLGSRDIDLVFPTRDSADKVLMPYYKAMGFKETGLFSKRFYKEITTEKGSEKIELDACSLSDRNLLHENKNIEVPWELVLRYDKEWEIQKGLVARVPVIELLLIYKVKALCDRRYDSKHLKMSMIEKSYINSKIWKDEYDINNLSNCKINRDTLNELLEIADFKSYFKEESERLKIKIL